MTTTMNTTSTTNPPISTAEIPMTPYVGATTLLGTVRNILVVSRREVRDSVRDWRIMVPIFVLTLVFPILAQGMTAVFTNFFVQAGAAPLVENFVPLLP